MDVIGVDFSGARDAGAKTWVAAATWCDGTLRVTDCRSLAARAGTADRAPALSHLCDLLAAHDGPAGLDFSFGLPRAVLDPAATWPDGLAIVAAHEGPDALRATCTERAHAHADGDRTFLKRATDERTGASSPYHWLVAHQTFYGVRDVLAPLVDRGASAPPMRRGDPPWLCEIYPAATLRSCSLPDRRYKDDARHDGARGRRARIVDGLAARTPLEVDADTRETLVADEGGDALDSVVAALAAWRAWRADFAPVEPWTPVEGHIYV
ncbi:DUF429 domain-containing protein [Halomarina ordinaria]|uniref:DUF429 domain-containing protein n=1 Tax=Halomarina ordinaria TaxID=3033939 RepID=A0ABD5UE69_9EURY|nr:DUF429 domain-containing protein [Halomarina sp. PSRA2]